MDVFQPISSEDRRLRSDTNPMRSVCIFKGAGKGKTTELARLAVRNKGYLIVDREQTAKNLIIVFPGLKGRVFSILQARNGKLKGLARPGEPIYVDEVGNVIQEYLGFWPTGISFCNWQEDHCVEERV
jgi:hypothetical protein